LVVYFFALIVSHNVDASSIIMLSDNFKFKVMVLALILLEHLVVYFFALIVSHNVDASSIILLCDQVMGFYALNLFQSEVKLLNFHA